MGNLEVDILVEWKGILGVIGFKEVVRGFTFPVFPLTNVEYVDEFT